MSLTDEIAALKAASDKFHADFAPRLARKVQATKRADNAKELNGQTLAELNTDVDATLTAHKTDRNAHGLTFADLQTYDGSDVDAIFAHRPKKGSLPISRFGNLTYLPAGVSGSFEGATTSIAPRDMCMLLEDDGTLTYLRNGQNGSKLGVYYAYMANALGPALTQPVKTNRRYQPAYFPLNYSAAFIQSCSESVVLGRLQNASGVLGDWFLSVTGGTLDDTKHVGCLISAATFANLGITPGETIVSGDKVYLFSVIYGATFDINVWTLELASVIAGGTLTPTRMTGISTSSFNNRAFNTDCIRITDMIQSPNLADKPLVHNPENRVFSLIHFERPSLKSYDNGQGTIRMKIFGNVYCPTTAIAEYAYTQFSFQFNPSAKVCTVDSQYLAGGQNTITSATPGDKSTSAVLAGALFNGSSDVTEARSGMANTMPHVIYSGQWMFNFRVHQVVETLDLTRTKFTAKATSGFAALLKGTQTGQSYSGITVIPSYGSAIGGALLGPVPLSNTRAMVYCLGKDAAGKTTTGFAYTDLEGSPNAAYDSLVNGPMVGYRPSANRHFFKDVLSASQFAAATMTYGAPLVEAGTTDVSVSGGHFVEGWRLTVPRIINPDLSTSGTMTVSAAVLAKARTDALQARGINARDSMAQLIIPRTLAGKIPPFILVTFNGLDNSNGSFVAQVTPTWSGDTITNLVVGVVSPPAYWQGPNGGGIGLSRSPDFYALTTGAVTLYETSTSVLVGISQLVGMLVVGNAPSACMSFRYSKAGNWVWPTNLNMQVFNAQVNGNGYYGSPGLGFGQIAFSDARADYGTKLPFMPITLNNDAEFDAWAPGSVPVSKWKVLTSQDVAATWMLYFTEPTPLLVNGVFYTLQQQTIDLTTIKANPANTTFYVYAQIVGGVASYLLETGAPAESSNKIYLGPIRTGTTSIETVAIEKTTKVWYFRPSVVARGSSIAASSGLPSSPATLNWS